MKKHNSKSPEWTKLAQIVKDTQITKIKKDKAHRVKSEFELKRVSIKDDQLKAQQELDNVAPEIEETNHSISNIRKSKLDEIKRLSSPPEVIKGTPTAVMMLLGLSASNWTAIKKTINGDGFIKAVLEFNIDNVKLNKESQYQIISTQQISYSIKLTIHHRRAILYSSGTSLTINTSLLWSQ